MENTNKSSNKLNKSKKYKGIYNKDSANDKMYCYNLRNEEINKVRLNDNSELSNKLIIIKFHEIAIDYFYYPFWLKITQRGFTIFIKEINEKYKLI